MRSLVTLLVVSAFCLPVYADEITSRASGDVGGVPKVNEATASIFNFPISAEVTYNGFLFANRDFSGPAFARAKQNITVLGALGEVEIEGLFADGTFGPHSMKATNELVSEATVAGNHNFSIFVTGAVLQNISFAGIGPLALIETSLNITLDLTQGATTTNLFTSTATLTGSTLVETGVDLTATPFGTPTQPGFSFDGIFTNLDLGFLNVGDFVTYTYEVTVTAPGFETGGVASIGDPNRLSGGQLAPSGPVVPDPIPEPVSVLLLGAGLAVLARRRKAA